jgi:hypothetical protein
MLVDRRQERLKSSTPTSYAVAVVLLMNLECSRSRVKCLKYINEKETIQLCFET